MLINEVDHETHDLDEARQRGHEPDVIATRAILFWGMMLFGTIVGSFILVLLFKDVLVRTLGDDPTVGIASRDETPVPPGMLTLDPDQAAELVELMDSQRTWLESYAWGDQQAGIARIPIKRAMAIVAKDGIPVLPPTPITSAAPANQ
jgi:hypothetical protein